MGVLSYVTIIAETSPYSYLFNYLFSLIVNPLSADFTKWPKTLKQFIGKLPMNCLSVFGHFVGLALTWLIIVFLIS